MTTQNVCFIFLCRYTIFWLYELCDILLVERDAEPLTSMPISTQFWDFGAPVVHSFMGRMQSSGMWRRVDLVWTDVPPESQFTHDLHGATSQKTVFFIVTAVETSNLNIFSRSLKLKRYSSTVRVYKEGKWRLCLSAMSTQLSGLPPLLLGQLRRRHLRAMVAAALAVHISPN
jgi:hypothetical protein